MEPSVDKQLRKVVTHKVRYMEFIARLRRARKAARLTQVELGRLLNKPQAFVSKVETCERRLDVIEAAEWCVALNVSLKDILPEDLGMVEHGAAKRRSKGNPQ